MTPGVYNFDPIKQGSTFKFEFNWADELGATVNLTGYSARLIVGYADGSAGVLECSSANGRIVLGGTPFNIVGTVDRAVMLALKPGTYVYDLELSSAGGERYPLLTGRFPLVASMVGW
jgi:hypothetical protein